MVPGTLQLVVSDKVFFAAGYEGDKVGMLVVNTIVIKIVVSGLCACD